MNLRVIAAVVLLMFSMACAPAKQWGQGAIGGAIVGAAALGTAGGAIANNVTPPFKADDKDRGAGIAIGIATGAILGALIGHALFDDEEAPPPEAPPPPPTKQKLVLRGVNFDFDKYNLRPEATPILDEAAKILNENPGVNIQVQGYTDWIGSDAYNLTLSDRRAETVKDYLVGQGVAASRLTAQGFGKADPVATNETEAGRAQNRRVELVPQS
ncbi:MAG: OmpA family protein [Deltaproteobacteria bacterium]|nr:OmpA family protein [Deltaproteobacteria bacterium]